MLIIAGRLTVKAQDRARFLDAHDDLIRRARAHPGCLDLVIAADPIEQDRVNTFEHWESEEHLASWRSSADPPKDAPRFLGGDVRKYQISGSSDPFE